MNNKNWGGKRSNSGRNKVDEKRNGYTIYLTNQELKDLMKYGKNKSEAVRNLIYKLEK